MAVGRLSSERIQVAPSCSLLHIQVDLEAERQLDPEIKTWLAFKDAGLPRRAAGGLDETSR